MKRLLTLTSLAALPVTSIAATDVSPALTLVLPALNVEDMIVGGVSLVAFIGLFYANKVFRILPKAKHAFTTWKVNRTYKRNEKKKGSPVVVSTKGADPRMEVMSPAVGSTLYLLLESDKVDPVYIKNLNVILIEQLRHAKATAQTIKNNSSKIINKVELSKANNITLPKDLQNSAALAKLAYEAANNVIQTEDVYLHNRQTQAATLWYRAQLDQCISQLAIARSKMLPAIESWRIGISKSEEAGAAIEKANQLLTEDLDKVGA